MIAIESWKPMHERVVAIQAQIRIAIQNHQVLALRHKLYPSDVELKNRITGIQNLIVAMSNSQSQLLAQCRKDSTSLRGLNQAKNQVWLSAAKNIPVYKKLEVVMKQEDTKRIANWKRKAAASKRLLLKSANLKNGLLKKKLSLPTSKIKVLVNNESLLKTSKAVSKSKAEDGESPPCDKCPSGDCQCSDSDSYNKESQSSTENLSDDLDVDRSSRSPSNSRSASTSPKPKFGGKKVKNCIKSVRCYPALTKSRKLAELKFAERDACRVMTRSKSPIKKEESFEFDSLKADDKELFLRSLGLISKNHFESIKRKRCERKRRSVAGQNSMYNDYFQPVGTRRSYAPRKVSNSRPTSPSAQVVVETAGDVDDDEEKLNKTEAVCSICEEGGSLETCPTCSDTYHEKCLPAPSEGCPSCTAEPPNISNIVGAVSGTSASSSELIKRYSTNNSGESTEVKSTTD